MNRLNYSSEWSQNCLDYTNRLDHTKKSTTDAIKTASKKEIWRKAEAAGDLIGNKLLVKLLKSQELQQRLVQRHLQMNEKILNLIEEHGKKNTDLQKKDSKYW